MSALRDGFVNPRPEFSPVPIWWWSGDRVTLDRLRRQLDQLVAQGVHNVIVLNLAPVGPLYGSLADDPAFYSEEWWELWEGLCAHAADRGDARLWFYDQIGFSGANLQGRLVHSNPEFAGTSLERTDTGEIRFVRQGFDYLSPESCSALLDIVHGEFERRLGSYLGNVIAGSFQDELPSLPTWTGRFVEEFSTRAGYEISPRISALWEGDDSESSRTRMDYQRVRAELAEESFFRPLFEWHERHGMIVGVDQQSRSRAGEPLDTVRQYADYCRTHRWFSAPGSDHHGEARIHSSLAHHYGRPRTWIESFHSSGWGGTLEETFDWLVPWLLAGATLYDPHAVYYSTSGGWWEWAPPSTCWRQPYWRHYKHFADAVSRLCWLLTQGSHVCDVGVLFPSSTVRAGTLLSGGELPSAEEAHRCYLELVGRMVWYDAHRGVLDRCHRDFDVLDDDTVTNALIADGTLRTAAETYRAVVLPSCEILESATAEALVRFASSGGLLIAIGAVDSRVAELAVRVNSAEDVAGVLERLGRPIDADGPALHRVVGDEHVLVIPAGRETSATAQPILAKGESWADDMRRKGYDFDPARYRHRCVVRLDGPVFDLQQWDPQTAEVGTVSVARGAEDCVEAEVTFDGPVAVLIWHTDPARATPTSSVVPFEMPAPITTLEGPWQWELEPRKADLPVQQWRLEHRHSVDEPWGEVLVSYGTFGWLRGPCNGTPTAEDEWRPLRYSLTRGIEKDPLSLRTLGPKGMVPEEFWHVGDVKAAQIVELRTTLPCEESGPVWLAIGTNGEADVWWNGAKLPPDPGGYLRLDEVSTRKGPNSLELRVTAETDGVLRGSWALTTDPDSYVRPLWLAPGDGAVNGTKVRASGRLELSEPPGKAILQVATEGPARLYVNGREIGVQGAFEPYGMKQRVLPYDITVELSIGINEIDIELTDLGQQPAVLVDAVVESGLTEQTPTMATFGTDESWTMTRDGVPVRATKLRRQLFDPRWVLLRPRSHPLPSAAPEVDNRAVLEIVPDAGRSPHGAVDGAESRPAEYFRLTVPPGARKALLPVHGSAVRVWVDGVERGSDRIDRVGEDRARHQRWVVDLAGGRAAATVEISVVPVDGRTEGALWEGPVEFELGPEGDKAFELQPWADIGLGSYSGGIRYRKIVTVARTNQVILDLGKVRGTAEVRINGRPAGVRIWSPYRLDITEHVVAGENELEVLICNTLAPYLDDASPTQFVFPGQRLSGMLGPVQLEER